MRVEHQRNVVAAVVSTAEAMKSRAENFAQKNHATIRHSREVLSLARLSQSTSERSFAPLRMTAREIFPFIAYAR